MTIPLQYLVQPCSSTKGKISLGLCGRFTLAELLSVTVSIGVSGLIFKIIVSSFSWMMIIVSPYQVVCVWVLTGHWALMDFMGMGLCVAFIAFVRSSFIISSSSTTMNVIILVFVIISLSWLPSLKVSSLDPYLSFVINSLDPFFDPQVAKSKSFHASSFRTPPLWCLLGFLLTGNQDHHDHDSIDDNGDENVAIVEVQVLVMTLIMLTTTNKLCICSMCSAPTWWWRFVTKIPF